MLDKRTVMSFLKEYADLQHEYSLLDARQKYLVRAIKDCEKVIDEGPGDIYSRNLESLGAFLTAILLGLMGTPFAAIIAIFIHPAEFLYKIFHWTFANNHPFLTHILFSFSAVTILAIPLSIPMCKNDPVEHTKRYQNALAQRSRMAKETSEISQQKQAILLRSKQLDAQAILHRDYVPYASKLWWYFEKGRVDTLKEAINLLEHDLDGQERQEAEKEYRNMMRQQVRQQQETLDYTADETSRAADAAQSAAAWSATGTFLTAVEIERQRKKDRE